MLTHNAQMYQLIEIQLSTCVINPLQPLMKLFGGSMYRVHPRNSVHTGVGV